MLNSRIPIQKELAAFKRKCKRGYFEIEKKSGEIRIGWCKTFIF